MAFPNITDIVATTIENRSKTLADNVTKNNAFLTWLVMLGLKLGFGIAVFIALIVLLPAMAIMMIVALLLAILASPALAHDFWIEPSAYAPQPGDVVTLRLLVGERLAGESLPRNDAMTSSFVMSGPEGTQPVAGRDGLDPGTDKRFGDRAPELRRVARKLERQRALQVVGAVQSARKDKMPVKQRVGGAEMVEDLLRFHP